MMTPAIRRAAFALILGTSSSVAAHVAFAQTATTGPKTTTITTDDITGTDPMPTGCGCGPKSSPKLTATSSLFFLQ